MVERSAHNRLVVGSIPTEPRTTDVSSEDFGIREMLEVLMGPEGKRRPRLRHRNLRCDSDVTAAAQDLYRGYAELEEFSDLEHIPGCCELCVP